MKQPILGLLAYTRYDEMPGLIDAGAIREIIGTAEGAIIILDNGTNRPTLEPLDVIRDRFQALLKIARANS